MVEAPLIQPSSRGESALTAGIKTEGEKVMDEEIVRNQRICRVGCGANIQYPSLERSSNPLVGGG